MARKNKNANKPNRKSNKQTQKEFEKFILNNAVAMEEGPAKKTWTVHDIRNIQPLTPTQEDMFEEFEDGQHICAHGSAGTGKTFLGLYLALREMMHKDSPHDRIIIVRSAVSTRDVGFMPGDLDEKMSFYETPYRDICTELFGKRSTYDDMKAANKIIFMPTTFIRGMTWDDCIVVVDEGQNMTFHEINSIMTRLGVNSRIIFTGDIIQTDLRKNARDTSGMAQFLKVIVRMKEFSSLHFTHDDIVRSKFVKEWIIATEEGLQDN